MNDDTPKSETAKHRDVTARFCKGNGIDIGSGGDPVVPEAIQIELPEEQFWHYNSGKKIEGAIYQREGHLLPFKDETLDYVYSSHLLEDYSDWSPVLDEWVRVLKRGGHLIILVPDKERWMAYVRRGGPPNCQHRHEAQVGELSTYATKLGLTVFQDEIAKPDTLDHTIIFIAQKI